jgi:hypothetical protein
MPTATWPKDAAENVTTRMLNKAQRTMDRFIQWPFLEFVQGRTGDFACELSLCRKTLDQAHYVPPVLTLDFRVCCARQQIANEQVTGAELAAC